jgi:hypothetical protein
MQMSTRARRTKSKTRSRRRRATTPSPAAKLGKLLRDASAGQRKTIYSAIKKMVGSKKRVKVRHSETAEKRLVVRYHELADKQLQSTASPKELAELERIQVKLGEIEKVQSAEIDEIQEQRHKAVIEQLTSLTTELRKMTASNEQQA